MTLRRARPADGPVLYDICLRTGDLGGDATGRYRDPRLLGEVYVGPYLAFEPDLAFVVAEDAGTAEGADGAEDGDGAGRVGGYVLGALDTVDFQRRCEQRWWPTLRARYPRHRYPHGHGDPDAAVVDLIHHPRLADPEVLARYPSHLHVDLLPAWQGGGWGRRLLERLFDALAEAGSPGVHLGVARRNDRAVGFYRRMGFAELAGDDGGLTMGRRLDG